ncbi:MAG: hypothetical protein R3C14_13570 [Caldilineaceae bacterium]
MITVLSDHDIEGKVFLLWGTVAATGWLEMLPLRLVRFRDVDLPADSTDRTVWRFAQANGMILLTNNHNMEGVDSLEQTIREENTPTSLPVLTIGDFGRITERVYREKCAARLVEIMVYLDDYLGVGRMFIP